MLACTESWWQSAAVWNNSISRSIPRQRRRDFASSVARTGEARRPHRLCSCLSNGVARWQRGNAPFCFSTQIAAQWKAPNFDFATSSLRLSATTRWTALPMASGKVASLEKQASRHVQDGIIGNAAFLLEQGHDFVSVFHMEYFAAPTQLEQLSCICLHLDDARLKELEGGRQIANSNRFAVLNSGAARQAVREGVENRVSLRIEKDPLPGALFHAGLKGYGMDGDGDLAAEALKSVALLSVPRRELPDAQQCNCSIR